MTHECRYCSVTFDLPEGSTYVYETTMDNHAYPAEVGVWRLFDNGRPDFSAPLHRCGRNYS